jgi:hypothetical protein
VGSSQNRAINMKGNKKKIRQRTNNIMEKISVAQPQLEILRVAKVRDMRPLALHKIIVNNNSY